jgi:hypothetical protein
VDEGRTRPIVKQALALGAVWLIAIPSTAKSQFNVLVSDWACCLGTAILPAIWLVSFRLNRRKQRQVAGLCRRCGYDLRASKGRCPECGTVPALAQYVERQNSA